MKNYYEILEVSKNASKEVIEKAYKVLAKKYHPDLQQEAQKDIAEQKMKLINEAYEILSDEEKRKNFDYELKIAEQEKINEEKLKQNQENKEQINENSNNIIQQSNYNTVYEPMLTKEQLEQQLEREMQLQRQYQEAQDRMYRNYMRSLGYKFKERWTLKRFIKLLETIGILIIVILIIWFFPPTHKLILQIYEENSAIKFIVDTVIKIIKSIINGIS